MAVEAWTPILLCHILLNNINQSHCTWTSVSNSVMHPKRRSNIWEHIKTQKTNTNNSCFLWQRGNENTALEHSGICGQNIAPPTQKWKHCFKRLTPMHAHCGKGEENFFFGESTNLSPVFTTDRPWHASFGPPKKLLRDALASAFDRWCLQRSWKCSKKLTETPAVRFQQNHQESGKNFILHVTISIFANAKKWGKATYKASDVLFLLSKWYQEPVYAGCKAQ